MSPHIDFVFVFELILVHSFIVRYFLTAPVPIKLFLCVLRTAVVAVELRRVFFGTEYNEKDNYYCEKKERKHGNLFRNLL